MEFRTHHGQTITARPGQVVVKEHYKGFLNAVTVWPNMDAAIRHKEHKVLMDSYMMQRNYHWTIQTIKEQ